MNRVHPHSAATVSRVACVHGINTVSQATNHTAFAAAQAWSYNQLYNQTVPSTSGHGNQTTNPCLTALKQNPYTWPH